MEKSKSTSLLLFLTSLSFLVCSTKAYNITAILNQYPSFSTFNNYLSQTGIANEISSETITILAVSDDSMSPLSGKPMDVIRKVMSVHVVLDYEDVKKLKSLANGTTKLTTYFQSSGLAKGDQGFLNVTDTSDGGVMFGSSANDGRLDSRLVVSVIKMPYDVSVLQVSNLIIPRGIDSIAPSASSPPPPPSPPMAPSPSNDTAPAPSPRKMLPPPAKSPSPSDDNEGEAPSEAPEGASDSDSSKNVGTVRHVYLGIVSTVISLNLLFLL